MLGKFYETGKWEITYSTPTPKPKIENFGNSQNSQPDLSMESSDSVSTETRSMLIGQQGSDTVCDPLSNPKFSNYSKCDAVEYNNTSGGKRIGTRDGLNSLLPADSLNTPSIHSSGCRTIRTTPFRVKQDPLRILILHCLFIMSSWCHILAFKSCYTYFSLYFL